MDSPPARDVVGAAGARAPLDRSRLAVGMAAAGVRNTRVLPRVGSTSTAVLELLTVEGWQGPALLAAEDQVAGRGRAGHDWHTPVGAALTFSLAVRPGLDRTDWGWLPLVAGLAVVRAITAATGLNAGLKWPNDVLIPEVGPELPGWGTSRKVGGILTEVTPDGRTVVFGIGINSDQTVAELPVPQAGSLRTAGGRGVDRTDLLIAVVATVLSLVQRDPGPAVREEIRARCLTLGQVVTANVPGGGRVHGAAVAINDDGALVLRDSTGSEQVLMAGDVHHLRPAGELGSIE